MNHNNQTEGAAHAVRPPTGDLMLDTIHDMIRKYVALPNPHAAVVATLWIVHTWCVMAFFTTPRLIIESPEPGSGKTRLLELLALLSHNGKVLLNTSVAALYRRISASEHPPTVLQDEYDAVFGPKSSPGSEDLRALYNGGYRRGATVDRCEGDGAKMTVVEFKVYAPVAMAGIGSPPRTISTRGITIPMRKRAPGEKVAPYRERDALDEAAPLVAALQAWAAAHFDVLVAARPELPEGVVDRPAEVWEPLLAIADQCGGAWPELARAACKHFVLSVINDTASIGVRLLDDIHRLYHPEGLPPVSEMHSSAIVSALTSDEDSPWRDLWGKQLDQRRLASELRKYDIRPKQLRIDGKVAKGYVTEPHRDRDGESLGLEDAWRRYLPSNSRNSRNSRNSAVQDGQERVTDGERETASVTASVTNCEPATSTVTAVSPVTAVEGRAAPSPTSMPAQLFNSRPPRKPRARTFGKFRPPSGPGRCASCGWHMATQGHDLGCSAANEATA